MNLTSRILLGSIAGLVAVTLIGIYVSYVVLHEQGQELAREKMRAMTVQAESVRDSISRLSRNDAFDREKLQRELSSAADFRTTALYGTIPIVAAWKSIKEVAEQDGMEFRIPKISPRNPANEPTADELSILDYLKSEDAEEYFAVDAEANQMVYARPIRLDRGCLSCHGDPANSLTGDGKDPLGFEMENWKAGEIHGAFVLKSSLDRIDKAVASSILRTLTWIFPAGLLVALGVYIMIRRTIVGPIDLVISEISASSRHTLDAASEVSKASGALAEGANEQASSLEETSSTLEEIESMTRRNVANAESAAEISEEASAAAEAGSCGMEKLRQAMLQIQESSSEVSVIIKTIDEIAFRTNILALNAAVEAARAGVAGAGFAVVADEVKNLARRSAEAARETAGKIGASAQRSRDGVDVTKEVGTSLDRIADRVKALDGLILEVKASSVEQSAGIRQINTAVGEMDAITQASAASTEQLASAASQTSSLAVSLDQAVNRLRGIVFGAAKSSPGSSGRAYLATSSTGHLGAKDDRVRRPAPVAKVPADSMWD